MTKLPPLQATIARKLDLQWHELTRSHNFPEEGLKLPDNRRADGELRTGHLQAAFEQNVSDRFFRSTVVMAKLRFEEIAGEYLVTWSLDDDPRTEVFAEWLREIEGLVTAELAELWGKSEWHPSFQQRCLNGARETLSSLTDVWKSRARRLEIQRLENPHLSMASLVAAEGDTKVALTLDQGKKAVGIMQHLIRTLDAIPPIRQAEDDPDAPKRESPETSDQPTQTALSPTVNDESREGSGANPSPQGVSPGYIPSQQRMGSPLFGALVSPGSIPSQQKMGSPIIHLDLVFPLLRHELAAGANAPPQPQADALRKEIIRLANRIQALENPELQAVEAGDRWLDRLSITHGPLWELEEALTASADFCRDFAIHQLFSGKREMAAEFDRFAAKFDSMRNEYFPTPVASPAPARSTERPTGAHARTWEDVEIRFVSDERVQIRAGNHLGSRNYAEFGFEDGRSKTPNRAWTTLRFLAESEGAILRPPEGHAWTAVEKRIQEIRRRFRAYFKLSEDPFVLEGGYRARFKIGCAPSYKS